MLHKWQKNGDYVVAHIKLFYRKIGSQQSNYTMVRYEFIGLTANFMDICYKFMVNKWNARNMWKKLVFIQY